MRRTKGRPVQKTRGAALLAATALVMSGLAACGDEGGPGETSSTASPSAEDPSSSETSSSSGDASSGSDSSSSSAGGGEGEVAELPAAATKKTKAGAIAFNEFYQRQAGEALKTGQTDLLKQMAYDCDVCDTYRKKISDRAAKGITMSKNPNSVGKASATPRTDGGYRVTITIQAEEHHEVLKDGSAGRTAKAVTYTLTTDTQWRGGQWEVHDSVIIK